MASQAWRLNLDIPVLNVPSDRHTYHTRKGQVLRRHLALQRRPSRRVPPDGAFWAAEATSRSRTSAHQPPCGCPSPGSQPPAAAAGFSNVSNALAACLSTAPARPVVHQPLLEQQVTLCRLAAGAARRSAAAACIEWCLRTTRPAAPEGRGRSSPGRMPKERPPGRLGRGRERTASMSSSMKTMRREAPGGAHDGPAAAPSACGRYSS